MYICKIILYFQNIPGMLHHLKCKASKMLYNHKRRKYTKAIFNFLANEFWIKNYHYKPFSQRFIFVSGITIISHLSKSEDADSRR